MCDPTYRWFGAHDIHTQNVSVKLLQLSYDRYFLNYIPQNNYIRTLQREQTV